mmetsp:Transcript_121347/g.343384  ORF Transcript_121347/g.343384 Transcript_121347/m.343384 type:complete len:205 (+) Transcript_121347:549-1163(+)
MRTAIWYQHAGRLRQDLRDHYPRVHDGVLKARQWRNRRFHSVARRLRLQLRFWLDGVSWRVRGAFAHKGHLSSRVAHAVDRHRALLALPQPLRGYAWARPDRWPLALLRDLDGHVLESVLRSCAGWARFHCLGHGLGLEHWHAGACGRHCRCGSLGHAVLDSRRLFLQPRRGGGIHQPFVASRPHERPRNVAVRVQCERGGRQL